MNWKFWKKEWITFNSGDFNVPEDEKVLARIFCDSQGTIPAQNPTPTSYFENGGEIWAPSVTCYVTPIDKFWITRLCHELETGEEK